jgi:hypothetical protein
MQQEAFLWANGLSPMSHVYVSGGWLCFLKRIQHVRNKCRVPRKARESAIARP